MSGGHSLPRERTLKEKRMTADFSIQQERQYDIFMCEFHMVSH